MAIKKARVLRAVSIEGVAYAPDEVVQLDEKLAKAHESDGALDLNSAAVAYCEKTLGVAPVKHEAAQP